jgi:hypothetical protein
MRTSGGGTRPADAGQATCSCSGGHPTAPAVSAADTSRPDTNLLDIDLLDTDRGSGSSSGQPRGPRCPVPQPPRHRPRCPAGAGRRRTRSRRCGAAAGPRRLDLFVCAGHVVRPTRPAENGCPAAWTPDAACRTPGARAPGTADTPRPLQGMGDSAAAATLDSRQQDRSPPRNGVRPERNPNVRHRPPRPADRQIRSLAAAGNLASSWKGGAG